MGLALAVVSAVAVMEAILLGVITYAWWTNPENQGVCTCAKCCESRR